MTMTVGKMDAAPIVLVVVAALIHLVEGQIQNTFNGSLSSECVEQYYRIYITRRVPPRYYEYHHEALAPYPGTFGRSANDTRPDFRIVGGKIISIRDAPYQVLYGDWCGGTLIAPEWVITAAHCKEDDDYIQAGSTLKSRTHRYNICAHFTHPGWREKVKLHYHDFDYQLLLLEKPVPVTPMSRPIAIGTYDDLKPGALLTVSGWGHTKFRNSSMQEFLHRIVIPLIPSEQCSNTTMKQYQITPRMFCAGFVEGKKDACQGDSGGPVVSNGRLVGSVSFGVGCALAGKPGVYANVPAARNWIRRVTQLPL